MRSAFFVLSALTLVGQHTEKSSGEERLIAIPAWLPLIEPKHQKVEVQTPQMTTVSYDADTTFATLVGRLETIFQGEQRNGLWYHETGDASGANFAARHRDAFCVVQIQNQEPVHVSVTCGPATKAEVPRPELLPPGVHKVEYVVDGDCGAAALTYTNAGGGTEQRELALPAAWSFRAGQGAVLSILAQKKGAAGTVRVRIKVDGLVVRESVSTSAFGIASAHGKL